ncbi:MAG TPA: 50S ribosomal protein L11 methyltransferase [Opitutaceae bacterium]|nr:50S ribosomal protein L11 methyltransferase [Opitutaceae bacterium]
MGLHEVKAEIPIARLEEVDDFLLELGAGNWSLHEDVTVRRAWLVGIFDGEREAQEEWSRLQALLPEGRTLAAETRPLPDRDWRDSYKAHFKASAFGPLHWVPVWERDSVRIPVGEKVLWLDPGLAFGTGNHETTRLCAERLVTVAAKGDLGVRVVDAGCGSGILALSAVLLGFSDVTGFDNDPEAIRVSHENAELNGLDGRARFVTGDLTTGLSGAPIGLLLANIQADVLMKYSGELLANVAPGGTLVLSGILARELDEVRATFHAKAPAWSSDGRILGEWSDLVLMHPRA